MAHDHCDSCVSAKCRREECPVQLCANGCGTYLHCCKQDEHTRHTCWAALVPCLNSIYGCEEILTRDRLAQHLQHCPASVLMCRFSYDRRTTVSSELPGPAPSVPPPLHEEQGQAEDAELLLDERCLLGDVALSRQEDKYVQCNDAGPAHNNKFTPLSQLDLDIHCNTGIVTSAAQRSGCYAKSLLPRSRLCIDRLTNTYEHSLFGALTVKRSCCFPCNEIVRRDEFAIHWRDYHLSVQVDMCCIVERCPMQAYGCKHGEVQLTPAPKGSSLNYNQDADCVGLKLPVHLVEEAQGDASYGEYAQKLQKQQELALYGYGEEDESYDVLSQLPVEILMKICQCLDSLALWNLSQVSHYIRSVCFNLAKKKGIVYCVWQKNETTRKWEQGFKVFNCCDTIAMYGMYLCVIVPSMLIANIS